MTRLAVIATFTILCGQAIAQKDSPRDYAKFATPLTHEIKRSVNVSYSQCPVGIKDSYSHLSGRTIMVWIKLSDKSGIDLRFPVPEIFDQESSYFQPPQYQLTEFHSWKTPPTYSMQLSHCYDGTSFQNYYSLVQSKGGPGSASVHMNGDFLIISGNGNLFQLWDPKANRVSVSFETIAVPFESPKRLARWEKQFQDDIDRAQKKADQEAARKSQEEQRRWQLEEKRRQEESARKAKAESEARQLEAKRKNEERQRKAEEQAQNQKKKDQQSSGGKSGSSGSSSTNKSYEQAQQDIANANWEVYRQQVKLEFERMEQVKKLIYDAAQFYQDVKKEAVDRANRDYDAAEKRWEKLLAECKFEDLGDMLHDAYMTDLDIVLNRRDFVILGARIVATQNLAKTVGHLEQQRLGLAIQRDLADMKTLSKELDDLEDKLDRLKLKIFNYKPKATVAPPATTPSSAYRPVETKPELAAIEAWDYFTFSKRPNGTQMDHAWPSDSTLADPALPHLTMARFIATIRYFVLDCEKKASLNVLDNLRGQWHDGSQTLKSAQFLTGTSYEGWSSLKLESLSDMDMLSIHSHNNVAEGHSAKDVAKRIAEFLSREYVSPIITTGNELKVQMFKPEARAQLKNQYFYTIEPMQANGRDSIYIMVFCYKKR